MVKTGFRLRTLLTTFLMLAALPLQALEIVDLQYNRAFSPNDDGSEDICGISFTVNGQGVDIDSILVGIYSSVTVPPDPGDLLTLLYPQDPPAGDLPAATLELELEWDGGCDAGVDSILPDGFYYLMIKAVADTSIWLDPPVQLEINTTGPEIDAVALEPSPYFTPLATAADTLLQIFFSSTTFDTLTDLALARIFQYDVDDEDYDYFDSAEFDREFHDSPGGLPRYRFLWNGGLSQGDLVDGLYRVEINLSDDAGNGESSSLLDINMDVEAPVLRVQSFGPHGHDTQYTFMAEDLPDSIMIGARDRNGVVSCQAAWGSGLPYETEGVLTGTVGDSSTFAFALPESWSDSTDTTLRIYLEATDGAGNLLGDLGSNLSLTIHLDDTGPPVPVWEMPVTHFIQQPALLRGRCDESGVNVILYEGGDSVATMVVMPDSTWFWPAELPLGESSWQAGSCDEAGNLSALSEELILTYSDQQTIEMPGRFYGGADETIRINAEPGTTRVTMRVYTLDGSMVRMIEAAGDPASGQYHIDWDLNDSRGRPLLGGLYIVNLAMSLESGQSRYERKVVALVRN